MRSYARVSEKWEEEKDSNEIDASSMVARRQIKPGRMNREIRVRRRRNQKA